MTTATKCWCIGRSRGIEARKTSEARHVARKKKLFRDYVLRRIRRSYALSRENGGCNRASHRGPAGNRCRAETGSAIAFDESDFADRGGFGRPHRGRARDLR